MIVTTIKRLYTSAAKNKSISSSIPFEYLGVFETENAMRTRLYVNLSASISLLNPLSKGRVTKVFFLNSKKQGKNYTSEKRRELPLKTDLKRDESTVNEMQETNYRDQSSWPFEKEQ